MIPNQTFFLEVDLATLEDAAGGASMFESLRGLDAQGTGYWGIDSYDNGATTYWSGPQTGFTELPYGYNDWSFW